VEVGHKTGVANCLEGIGAAVGVLGYPVEGVRLLAAGAALREELNAPLPAKDRKRYDESLGAVKALLSEEMFGEAWAEGHRLSMEEAVERALDMDKRIL
jgi:hypothetical protein